MKNRILLAFLPLLLIFACKKSTDFPTKKLSNIIGEWNWESATGGLAGNELTPATEGYTLGYFFQKDKEYIYYKDSIEQRTGYYWIEEGSSIFSAEPVYLLKLGNRDHSEVKFTYSIELDGKNILYLNEECNDCYHYKFT